MCGIGVYLYRDGSIYTGEFYKNKKEGKGEMIFKYKDGIEKYVG